MCLAIPGKIINIENGMAVVEYGDVRRKVSLIDRSFKKGDYVIVQAKTVMMKIPKKQAEETLKFIADEA